MTDIAKAQEAPKPPVYPETIDQMVEQYVRLRDTLTEAEKKHNEKLAPAKAYLEGLNAAMMTKLAELGIDSAKTGYGTVYKTHKKSATIADGDLFRGFVIANAAYDLVDWRANAPAVDGYIKDHNGELPPGVNYSTATLVGVRRS